MRWVVRIAPYFGWVALWVSFFCPSVVREQILAVVSILCTFTHPSALHVVVATFIVVYFTQTGHRPEAWAAVAHHIIIGLSVLVQYIDPRQQVRSWVALCWSSRWLGSFLMYSAEVHPVRECLKCILFYVVVECHRSWRFAHAYDYKNSIRWLWVLFVNEIAWIFLPVQMLVEVYSSQKTTLPV